MWSFLKLGPKPAPKRPSFQPSVEKLGDLLLPSGFNAWSFLASPPPTPMARFAAPGNPPPVRFGMSCGPFSYSSAGQFSISTPVPSLIVGAQSPLKIDQHGSLSTGFAVPIPVGPVPWGVTASASFGNGPMQVWAGPFIGLPACNFSFQFQIYGR